MGAEPRDRVADWLAACAAAAAALLMRVDSLPLRYGLYMGLPILCWWRVLRARHILATAALAACQRPGLLLHVAAWVGLLEVMVAGVHQRALFTLLFLLLAALLPMLRPAGSAPSGGTLHLAWRVACVAVAVFPLAPLEMGESVPLVAVGALACALVGAALQGHGGGRGARPGSVWLPRAAVLAVLVPVAVTHFCLATKAPVPAWSRWAAFATLPASFAPLAAPAASGSVQRLGAVLLATAAPYVLLSASYEACFMAALAVALTAWVALEAARSTVPSLPRARAVRLEDMWTALLFVAFLQIAFFGTGNVSSISSFELASTCVLRSATRRVAPQAHAHALRTPSYRFVTVFSPFLMAALLIFKLLLPYILVAVALRVVAATVRVPPQSLFLLALLGCDIMALHLLFLVRDEGSWKEIGNSISHYVIMSAHIVFIPVLLAVAALLTRVMQVDTPAVWDGFVCHWARVLRCARHGRRDA